MLQLFNQKVSNYPVMPAWFTRRSLKGKVCSFFGGSDTHSPLSLLLEHLPHLFIVEKLLFLHNLPDRLAFPVSFFCYF